MIEVSRPPGQSNRSRAMLALLAVALLVLSSNGAADPAAQTQPRSPVPNADQVASAETQIRELFKNEYATTNAADYLALSRKLLTQALDTSNDMPSRYVLY